MMFEEYEARNSWRAVRRREERKAKLVEDIEQLALIALLAVIYLASCTITTY